MSLFQNISSIFLDMFDTYPWFSKAISILIALFPIFVLIRFFCSFGLYESASLFWDPIIHFCRWCVLKFLAFIGFNSLDPGPLSDDSDPDVDEEDCIPPNDDFNSDSQASSDPSESQACQGTVR